MCGIARVYAPGGRRQGGEAVGRMLDSMHRGTDDRGVQPLVDGRLVLGHLRLSILDLSPPRGREFAVYLSK